jgi:hypothetical protein
MMPMLSRVRGHDYQIIKDLIEIQRPWFEMAEVRRTTVRDEPELTPHIRTKMYYHAYWEYEVTEDGVTRIAVFLPEGVKPPEEGPGLQDGTKTR